MNWDIYQSTINKYLFKTGAKLEFNPDNIDNGVIEMEKIINNGRKSYDNNL